MDSPPAGKTEEQRTQEQLDALCAMLIRVSAKVQSLTGIVDAHSAAINVGTAVSLLCALIALLYSTVSLYVPAPTCTAPSSCPPQSSGGSGTAPGC